MEQLINCNLQNIIDPFHVRHSIAVTASHNLWTVEVKQENWDLDSSETYRSQKNDLLAN